jgi:hypothetical protein
MQVPPGEMAPILAALPFRRCPDVEHVALRYAGRPVEVRPVGVGKYRIGNGGKDRQDELC